MNNDFTPFTTIADECRIEYVIEKSRFIATAVPCSTEEEAQAAILRISKEFWDATHNCTAFALGPRQERQRSSDNGEPSGTAGKPILEVLKHRRITDTLIVVSRYFGGIKLGAGGLIRAYSHAAAEVLNAAKKEQHAPRRTLLLSVNYDMYNAVDRYLAECDLASEKIFGESVSLEVFVAPEDEARVTAELRDLTAGRIKIAQGELRIAVLPAISPDEP